MIDQVALDAPAQPRRAGLVLAVCCLAQLTVILDASIVNVAIPSIQNALHFTPGSLTWVYDGYLIPFMRLPAAGRADGGPVRRAASAAHRPRRVHGVQPRRRRRDEFGDAGTRPRRAGLRRRDHGVRLAGRAEFHVHRADGAGQGARPVGCGFGQRRGDRRAQRRSDRRVDVVALGLPHQRAAVPADRGDGRLVGRTHTSR